MRLLPCHLVPSVLHPVLALRASLRPEYPVEVAVLPLFCVACSVTMPIYTCLDPACEHYLAAISQQYNLDMSTLEQSLQLLCTKLAPACVKDHHTACAIDRPDKKTPQDVVILLLVLRQNRA